MYASTSDNNSDTSIETYVKRRHRQKKEKKKKVKKKKEKKKEKKEKEKRLSSCGRRRRNTDAEKKENNCPHCKKFECRKPHPHVTPDKCMWNQKYKGYRFKSICGKLEVDSKPCHKFLRKMEGYKDVKSDEESE